jgi:NitT/TauT family transport system ATP-binding protein
MASSSTPAVVALREIGKTFANGVVALSGTSFTIHRNEFVSLLGPSGCGKSTALRIIAGLIEPSAGEIDWQDVPQDGPGTGSIGFVFQEPTLMPWASVAANVHLPLKLAGMDFAGAQSRITEVLARVGLSDFARAHPRELSGGMKMRVSIARALVTRPELLLMDEPFAALDEITRFKLNNDLLSLWHASKQTVVFVTHSVFESVFLSSRVLVMTSRPGRVFAEIDIDAPYPRSEAFRTSPEYAALCRRVSQTLAQAMAAEAA